MGSLWYEKSLRDRLGVYLSTSQPDDIDKIVSEVRGEIRSNHGGNSGILNVSRSIRTVLNNHKGEYTGAEEYLIEGAKKPQRIGILTNGTVKSYLEDKNDVPGWVNEMIRGLIPGIKTVEYTDVINAEVQNLVPCFCKVDPFAFDSTKNQFITSAYTGKIGEPVQTPDSKINYLENLTVCFVVLIFGSYVDLVPYLSEMIKRGFGQGENENPEEDEWTFVLPLIQVSQDIKTLDEMAFSIIASNSSENALPTNIPPDYNPQSVFDQVAKNTSLHKVMDEQAPAMISAENEDQTGEDNTLGYKDLDESLMKILHDVFDPDYVSRCSEEGNVERSRKELESFSCDDEDGMEKQWFIDGKGGGHLEACCIRVLDHIKGAHDAGEKKQEDVVDSEDKGPSSSKNKPTDIQERRIAKYQKRMHANYLNAILQAFKQINKIGSDIITMLTMVKFYTESNPSEEGKKKTEEFLKVLNRVKDLLASHQAKKSSVNYDETVSDMIFKITSNIVSNKPTVGKTGNKLDESIEEEYIEHTVGFYIENKKLIDDLYKSYGELMEKHIKRKDFSNQAVVSGEFVGFVKRCYNYISTGITWAVNFFRNNKILLFAVAIVSGMIGIWTGYLTMSVVYSAIQWAWELLAVFFNAACTVFSQVGVLTLRSTLFMLPIVFLAVKGLAWSQLITWANSKVENMRAYIVRQELKREKEKKEEREKKGKEQGKGQKEPEKTTDQQIKDIMANLLDSVTTSLLNQGKSMLSSVGDTLSYERVAAFLTWMYTTQHISKGYAGIISFFVSLTAYPFWITPTDKIFLVFLMVVTYSISVIASLLCSYFTLQPVTSGLKSLLSLGGDSKACDIVKKIPIKPLKRSYMLEDTFGGLAKSGESVQSFQRGLSDWKGVPKRPAASVSSIFVARVFTSIAKAFEVGY